MDSTKSMKIIHFAKEELRLAEKRVSPLSNPLSKDRLVAIIKNLLALAVEQRGALIQITEGRWTSMELDDDERYERVMEKLHGSDTQVESTSSQE